MADPIESAKSELRQQGAVETAERAAQDPQSNVRPENVEKVLIEESRKAGAPAFQFDPDAPPEEKAALAKSVSWQYREFANIQQAKQFN